MTAFADADRLADIVIDDGAPPPSAEIDQERRVAIYDLLEENRFRPTAPGQGPFTLRIDDEGGKLRLRIADGDGAEIADIPFSLAPLKALLGDYFTACESYFDAVKRLSPAQIEALDAERRAIHTEAAAKLQARLAEHAAVDAATARRLFTVVCALGYQAVRRGL